MRRELKTTDISNVPELIRLAEEVRRTAVPRLLRRDNEDLAILMPAKPAVPRKGKKLMSKADYDAFRSAFGGWKGIVDSDTLKSDLASERGSDRPPVGL